MLNSFLQFLDEDATGSLIVAATNHRELLDRAIFLRFDATVDYDLPEYGHVRRILTQRLPQFDLHGISWDEVAAYVSGLSQADITAAADDTARDAVLDHGGRVLTETVLRALEVRKPRPE